ncbi:phosphonate C-P lyase system protein PhnH [Alsobacter sp. SYSU M60028]|uniref:Phosphonate C-P lyase system protein PhnH n=1 Tax=Alsobacter ponti TaxID=2962936 RepID=A0ABT1L7L2_9HYPH|nr:phosphonate C-P lyase system protein PhnH [Alsobacter ponti]MCP8937359.1 phosphonate C-P lyase system protein PhnH [Alsobacter ponti]
MSAALKIGFENPVAQSQAVFRAVMMALARPGTVRRLDVPVDAVPALDPAAAAVALALCDYETPVWLDPALAADLQVQEFLRFHTGAPVTEARALASFAFVPLGGEVPALDDFAQGSLDYPDRSTTLVVAVEALAEGEGWRLTGPGVAGEGRFIARPLPADMLDRLQRNHALFPRGVDLVLTCGDRFAAIPRSTQVDA